MLKNDKVDELKRMYMLFSKVDTTMKYVHCIFKRFIKEKGLKIVNGKEFVDKPIEFTSELLKFKREIDTLVKLAFNDDMKF